MIIMISLRKKVRGIQGFEFGESLTLISIIVAILIGVVCWILSAKQTKKSIQKQKLQYEIRMHSIVPSRISKNYKSLEIYYDQEILPEPVLLTLNITNIGNIAIEDPPIEIEMDGATYIIPGHIEDIPVGYEDKWSLERTDAEICQVNIEHINPGQTLKAVFFLDEYPRSSPNF
ncbi:hypothetical protein LAV73_13805 [Lysinibacillus xylanilyticus]|uniref:hypothetical protein n=1 Tax=Lysinibacillus xylanilyticus TaxID=582475 RepID=UPI002B2460B0|nr:hypothetical protein [Lysinibacillus xylanilyticus]MEB2281065.1 hypothetical protein [Lysinibacillus xylanilyticus]